MSSPSTEIRRYSRAVVRRAWIVALVVVGLMAVAYYWRGAKPAAYSASALLMVTKPLVAAPSSVSGDQPNNALPTNVSMVINDIIQLLGSRPVTQRVADGLGLQIRGPEVVQRSVKASRIRDTDLVRIRATHSNRELAQKLANTSASVLITHLREVNRRDAREVRMFIEQQLAESRASLESSDRAVETFKIRHGILVFDAEASQASTNATQARTDRENAATDLKQTEAKLAAAKARLNGERQTRIVSGTIKDNPVFQQLETKLTDLEIQRANLSQTFTERHPKLITVEGEIKALQQRMRAVAKKVVDNEVSQANPIYDQLLTDIANYEVDRASLLARIGGLRVVERQRRLRNAAFPSIETGLNQLVRENETQAENYKTLSEKYQSALIRENEAGYIFAGIQIMEPAVIPSRTAGVRPLLQVGLAGLAGLLLGIIAAVLLETSDDRIRTSGDAERTLGAPVLAEVPDVTPRRLAPATTVLGLLAIMLCLAIIGTTLGLTDRGRLAGAQAVIGRMGRGIQGVPVWFAQVTR